MPPPAAPARQRITCPWRYPSDRTPHTKATVHHRPKKAICPNTQQRQRTPHRPETQQTHISQQVQPGAGSQLTRCEPCQAADAVIADNAGLRYARAPRRNAADAAGPLTRQSRCLLALNHTNPSSP
jgi:hypothetical protein